MGTGPGERRGAGEKEGRVNQGVEDMSGGRVRDSKELVVAGLDI